ncbi:MAG TPA: flavin reductase family protein [Solirubrobacteraceae bacterium]|nr:flavin reductase family protein [Solirubrobacteraceae bacterium]
MAAQHATAGPPVLEERRLRAAFGRFATGVAFVTTEVDGSPLGLIMSSFTAVSLDPPMISFCPARDSLTWRRMRSARTFVVNVLGEHHRAFARAVAPAGADRFAEPLRDPLAALVCTVEAELPCGDHSIVVGRVHRLAVHEDGDPLVYFGGCFGAFLPHHQEIPCPQSSNP